MDRTAETPEANGVVMDVLFNSITGILLRLRSTATLLTSPRTVTLACRVLDAFPVRVFYPRLNVRCRRRTVTRCPPTVMARVRRRTPGRLLGSLLRRVILMRDRPRVFILPALLLYTSATRFNFPQ